ncbi:ribonuclease H-like domain-containing protein [Tanacetum coccineum]|uniref:Ribonuclease H-like domain-containing protein n=1 Tax=Tanacetum coccineum TaxID=301880 RepID=A0ABQ4YDM7_9ASTR
MSNSNTNLQTQSSNALHNAIMEAGSKDRPPISLLGLDNDIYSTVDAVSDMHVKCGGIALKRLKTGESINVQDSLKPIYIGSLCLVTRSSSEMFQLLLANYNQTANKDRKSTMKQRKSICLLFCPTYDPELLRKIYKPTNNNLRTSSNTSRANQDNSPRTNKGTGYDHQRAINEYGSIKGRFRTLTSKGCSLSQGKNVYCDFMSTFLYMYMAKLSEVTPDPVDNSGPIFDDEPMHKEMVADLRYFNSLEHEVDTLKSQLETQKTQFLNEIDRLSREYYYADHMNAILGVYTDLDEVTNLQCDYLETWEKCERLEKELSKSRTMSKSFEALQKHAINLELDLQQCKEKIKYDKSFKENQSNVFLKERVIPNTRVIRPQLKSNHLEDRVMSNNSQGKKHEFDAKTRMLTLYVLLMESSAECQSDLCVLHYINGVNSRTRQPMAVPISTREPKQNVNQSVATSSVLLCPILHCLLILLQLVEIILFIIDSGCSKHMTRNLKLLTNFVEKFLGTMKFGNDQIAPTLSYGDLFQGTITIKWDYYVKGLNHNLFSVGQLCDADLEVAFQKSTCYIRDLKGNDLLTGSRGTDLYSITLQDSTTPNPICLMAKATSSQAWLWHRRLSHLNFDTINLLSMNNIVNGLPKLKFVKDHLCSSCELGKAKEKSINGKKYVLVIVDDYSRYTWTHFLRSKDETPGVLIDFLTLVQRGLHAQVTTVRTDKGMEFLNKNLHAYFAKEGIRHETSTARTPEQNGVVERRNRTLVEAARTMLSAAKVPLFFWAEAIATTCFTQNRSLVIPRHEKTPYHIINARKPSVKFFHIFGSLCYIVRDGENLDKMKEKGDACIFVGYSTQSKAYRVFNKRTRMIVETIHVNFDELPQMASDHVSSDPGPQCSTTVLEQDSLSPVFAVHAADNPDKRLQHNTTHTSKQSFADPPPLNIPFNTLNS